MLQVCRAARGCDNGGTCETRAEATEAVHLLGTRDGASRSTRCCHAARRRRASVRKHGGRKQRDAPRRLVLSSRRVVAVYPHGLPSSRRDRPPRHTACPRRRRMRMRPRRRALRTRRTAARRRRHTGSVAWCMYWRAHEECALRYAAAGHVRDAAVAI